MQTTRAEPELLGRGRSGTVFLDIDERGRRIARKVFRGEGLSRAVLYVLTGAPNPYGWCEHAVRAAVCRREILRSLVLHWFRGRLTVPRQIGWSWNESQLAFELSAEFVAGNHVPLRCSDSGAREDPLDDLVHGIMRPLQQHLMEAGFDGLVWQAGLGNPVAANNFLMDRGAVDRARGGEHEPQWAWIDLESGVPALFPINPATLVRFYLPRCIRHGRWLFDDADVPKLREYLERHRAGIERDLGEGANRDLAERVAELQRHQDAWRSLTRTERSIAYFRAQRRISPEQAEWYACRPLRWQARLLACGAGWGLRRLAESARQLWSWIRTVNWGRAAQRVVRFFVSQRFRERLARNYVTRRLSEWIDRKFLEPEIARSLRRELRRDQSTACVADFGVHLSLKPAAKILAWFVLPLLYVAGVVREPALLAAIVGSGAILRTVYTLGRIVQATPRGRARPWVALGVGLLPFLGNAAFPLQLSYLAVRDRRRLAQFLLYDTCARLGRSVPIWGGAGSLVEGWFNRIPDLPARWGRGRRLATVRSGEVHAGSSHASAAIPKL